MRKQFCQIFAVIVTGKKQQRQGLQQSPTTCEVHCQRKEAKKYEFSNKSSIVKTRKSGIIVGAMEQTQRITGHKPKVGIVDRGYKGRKEVNVQIIIPIKLPASANNYQKQKMRKRFRARAVIEPIFGHLKKDHRMSRNYLLDEQGDLVNTLLAATGFNSRKMLQQLKAGALEIFARLIWVIFGPVWNQNLHSEKQGFFTLD